MTHTRGLQFTAVGGPAEVLALADLDLPEPRAGQLTVDLEAVPVDPSDLGFVAGRYGVRPVFPSGVGQSGIGRVSALGPDTAPHRIGDRVLIIPTNEQFTWRERVTVAAANVVTVDPDADPVQLCTVGVNQITADQLLTYGALAPGDWIAQTGANSAVAASVIALAHRRGLRTLNIVRRPEAVELVDKRADAVLVADDQLADNLAATLAGESLALVLAATGSAVSTLIQSLRHKGTVVSYAALDRQPIILPNIVFGDHTVHAFWVTNWLRDTPRREVQENYRRVARLVADGTLRTPVEATYRLDDWATALAHATRTGSDGRQGKIFLTFPQH